MKNQTFELEFAGRKLTVELGKMANQANSSCLARYGDTLLLATAVMSSEAGANNYLPFSVEMQERMYAAGKIKGSRFIKREGRPTDNAILDARMIDRGLRPLFNQKLRHDIQVVLTTLSYDEGSPADVLAITAGAIALHLSDIPWNGPLVGVCVGKIDGQLVINPSLEQLKQAEFKLVFSVGSDKVLMIDAEAKEASEEEVFAALKFGVKEAQPLLKFVESLRDKVGLEKKNEQELIERFYAKFEAPLAEKKAAFEKAKEYFSLNLDKYLFNQPKGTKRERKEVAKVLLNEYLEKIKKDEIHEEIVDYIKQEFEGYLETEVSRAILEREQRIDGRKLTDIRPLVSEVGLLPRAHGSGLFSRGETQILSVVTLGAPGDAQILDEMTEDDTKKHYMHFYNCPPFSFGETGPFRSPGRREIGHGALAEKALAPMIPSREDFPYTILVVSEVMGSNGSSSMGSTCGSSLALMDAGVPIKKPVAGIAMGLASDGKKYKILTDLQDLEDGEGGMDFKVAGTGDGITAIQMDTKTGGLSLEICEKTLAQAKEARMEILAKITKTIGEPRKELSPYAPRIVSFHIDPEKIREVIGTGGKTINEIIDACGVEIDIEQDGLVMVTGVNKENTEKAVEWIQNIVKEVEPGEIYPGKVTRLMDFGAFVEFLPGHEGLVHISELANQRVNTVEDVVKIGDEVTVKVINIDELGRINLSIKQADPNYNPELDERRQDRGGFGERSHNNHNHHNDRGNRRPDRGGRRPRF